MIQQSIRVLLVEDEDSLREPLAQRLRNLGGYYVETAATYADAVASLRRMLIQYDVALIDDTLPVAVNAEPRPLGVQLMKEMRLLCPEMEFILFTNVGARSGRAALEAGAYRYVTKPTDGEELALLIQAAAEQAQTRRERDLLTGILEINRTLTARLGPINTLEVIVAAVRKLVGADLCSVALLESESGTVTKIPATVRLPAAKSWRRHILNKYLTRHIIESGEPYLVENIDQEELIDQRLRRAGIKSFVGVPLPGQSAVLYAYSYQPDFFSARAQQILEVVAGQAAIALDNAQLWANVTAARERAETTSAKLLALHDISREIQSELELTQLLNKICRTSAEMLGGDASAILLLDDEGRYLSIKGSYHLGKRIIQGTRDAVGKSIAGRVFQTGKPLIINDVPNDMRFENPSAQDEGFKAIISVPLRVRNKMLGTLDVHTKTTIQVWTDQDLQILELIAHQAAIAIENVRSFDEMERGLQTMRSLFAAGNTIAFAETDVELLASTVEKTRVALGCWRVKVALSSNGRGFRDVIQVGFDDGKDSAERIRPNGISAEVIRTGKIWLRTDVLTVPEEVNPVLLEDGVRAAACIPLLRQDEAVGVMWVHYREPRAFSTFDAEALRLYANQVALAITNARYVHNIETSTRTLSALYQAGSAILSQMMPEQVLHVIVREVQKALTVWRVKVALFDLETKKLNALAEIGFENAKDAGDTFRPYGKSSDVLASGEVWWCEDIQAEPESVNQPMIEDGVRAAACLPLKVQNESIGVIWLQYDVPRRFLDAELDAMRLFANQAAIAIANANLLTKIQTQEQQVKRLVASAPFGIVALDHAGYITDLNPKGEAIFGYALDEVRGWHVGKFYSGGMNEARHIGRLLHEQDGLVSDYETTVVNQDGEQIPLRVTCTWLYDRQDQQMGSVGYFVDMREIAEVQRRLELLVDASSEVAQASDLTEAMQSLARLLVQYLRVSFCRIFLLDTHTNALIVKAAFRTPYPDMFKWMPNLNERIPLAEWEGINGYLNAKSPTVLQRQTTDDQIFLKDLATRLSIEDDIQALLFVPIRTAQHVVGLLGLGDVRPTVENPFPVEKQNLAIAIAEQTASLIERIRLQEEAEEAHNFIQSFFESSNAIVSAQSPDKVLQDIVERVRKAVEAEGVGITIIDELGQASTPIVSSGYTGMVSIRPYGYSMQAFQSGKPTYDENMETVKQNSIVYNPEAFQLGVRAFICIPLKQNDKSVGVMRIHFHAPRHFPQPEIEALQLFANQAALAYDTARRMQTLENLRLAAEALAATTTTPEALYQIVHWAKLIFDAGAAAVWAYDSKERKFLLDGAVAAGIDEATWEEFRNAEPIPGETADQVMKLGWIGVTDVSNLEEFGFLGKSTRRLLSKIGVKSFQGIALKVGDETLGVLYINHLILRHFNFAEKETARAFANHAALALKKARLLEQVRKKQEIANVVADVSTLGDLTQTLDSVVLGTKVALDADTVILYVYDSKRKLIYNPPAMIGVLYPEELNRHQLVPQESIVYEMLKLKDIYVVDNLSIDSQFHGRRFAEQEKIRSLLVVALTIAGDVVGVMFVNYRNPHRFTSEELEDVRLYANQAAIAVRNAELFENEQRQTSALATLYAAGRTITASLNLQETLKRIAFQAAQISGIETSEAGYVGIALVQEQGSIEFLAAYPEDRLPVIYAGLGGHVVDLKKGVKGKIGIIGHAILTGKPQVVPDVKLDESYLATHNDIQSAVAVPIIYGDEIIGALNVEFHNSMPFLDERVPTLESLAATAAAAIENARLYEREKQRLDEASALQKVAEALAGTSELMDVLRIVMTEAKRLSQAPISSILFWDKEREVFSRALRLTVDGEIEEYETQARTIGGYSRRIIDGKRPIAVSDVLKDLNHNSSFVERGFRSVLGVPLMSQGEVMGILYVRSTEPLDFLPREIDLIMAVAGQAAVAIERTRHVEELKEAQLRVGGQAALAWMGMVSSAWQHTTHTNAVTIEDMVALTKQDVEKGAAPAKLHGRLNNIARMAQKIRTAPITPPLDMESEVQSIPINEFMRERIHRLWMHKPYNTVTLQPLLLEIDDTVTVRINLEWLREAVDIVLGNAIKYMRDSLHKELTIATRSIGRHVELEIRDRGPGIPDEVRARLFKVQIPKEPGSTGMGMGLLMANTILQTFGGEIEIKESGPQGTTMRILLPRES